MKEKKKLELIECSGTPYEIGKQYGTARSNSLVISINSMVKECSESNNTSKQEMISLTKKYLPVVEQFAPELIDMLKGQAAGAGLTFEEIFLLRCCIEATFYYQRLTTLCTSFAVTGRATQGGKTIIGQNFDWASDRPVDLVKIKHADGMEQLSLVFQGSFEVTLNSAGVGMVLNLVLSPIKDQRLVVPSCCVIPKAMRQQRIGDALGILCTAGRSPMHYCLASKEGDIISFEAYPDDYSVLAPEKDMLVHANHYHTERFKKGELVWIGPSDSYIREPRLRYLMETHYGDITVELMMQFMSDHNNYPHGICAHPVSTDPIQAGTLASIIMVPEDNTIYVTDGPPCQYEYVEYKL